MTVMVTSPHSMHAPSLRKRWLGRLQQQVADRAADLSDAGTSFTTQFRNNQLVWIAQQSLIV